MQLTDSNAYGKRVASKRAALLATPADVMVEAALHCTEVAVELERRDSCLCSSLHELANPAGHQPQPASRQCLRHHVPDYLALDVRHHLCTGVVVRRACVCACPV